MPQVCSDRNDIVTLKKKYIHIMGYSVTPISWNPLLYGILAGQSSPGKLGGREVKTSALVSRRSWLRIPPESPVKFFHRHSESTEYTVLYTRRCRATFNQLNTNTRE